MINRPAMDSLAPSSLGVAEELADGGIAALQAELVSLRGLNAALTAENTRLQLQNGDLSRDNEDLLSEVIRLAPFEDSHQETETSLMIADAEKKMNVDQVERLRLDGKTGLLTPLTWEEETLQQMRLHRRKTDTGACYLVIADLDHFKRVNDTFGHLYGDKVLRATGDVAKEALGVEGNQKDRRRHKPLAGRFGGEEFVFWLPDTNLQEVELFTKRFQTAVNGIEFPNKSSTGAAVSELHGRTTQGVSMGITEVNIDPSKVGESLMEALHRADAALYRVKETGRNGVQVSLPEIPVSI